MLPIAALVRNGCVSSGRTQQVTLGLAVSVVLSLSVDYVPGYSSCYQMQLWPRFHAT